MTSSARGTHGSIYPVALLASALVGLATISSVLLSIPASREATMYIEPSILTTTTGEIFVVNVTVAANLPVNAFTGKIIFNRNILTVEKIDYNTSIADLWAEEPWYNDGDGTLNFTGGTTRPGGFTGVGSLITITFKSLTPGNAELWLTDAHILQHDGMGTEATLSSPIDTVFTVIPETLHEVAPVDSAVAVTVMTTSPGTDLNQDGITNLRDISIFMLYLATLDQRGDISRDGYVTITDASIMLNAARE